MNFTTVTPDQSRPKKNSTFNPLKKPSQAVLSSERLLRNIEKLGRLSLCNALSKHQQRQLSDPPVVHANLPSGRLSAPNFSSASPLCLTFHQKRKMSA